MNTKATYPLIAIFFCFFTINTAFSQTKNVGIGTSTPDNSAVLDLESTSQGFLVPRFNTSQRSNIASPAEGLLIYDTDSLCFLYFNNTKWINLCEAGTAKKKKKGAVQGVTTQYDVVTDVRLNNGILERKKNTVTIVNGIITSVESGDWE